MSESIINKIKKLLSLSTSPNKAEANLAYKKAMELMLKHNIESIKESQQRNYASNIRFSNTETVEIKFIHEILVSCFFVQIVSRRMFCEVDKKLKNRYTYYASDINLQIAMYAFDFLKRELPIMWRIAKRREGFSQKERQSYYYGITVGFCSIYKEVKNYSENKYEIVLSETDPELDAFIKERHPGCKASTMNPIGPLRKDAFSIGEEDGKELKINQAISTKPNQSSNILQLN